MHDGRISKSNIFGNGFNTPAEEWLPSGLDNILSVQALFPMTRQFEMAGNFGENEIIGLVSKVGKDSRRIDRAWPVIENKIRGISEYHQKFMNAYEDINDPMDIKIIHIANAISAFIIKEWTSFDSPFDDFIKGKLMLSPQLKKRNGFVLWKSSMFFLSFRYFIYRPKILCTSYSTIWSRKNKKNGSIH